METETAVTGEVNVDVEVDEVVVLPDEDEVVLPDEDELVVLEDELVVELELDFVVELVVVELVVVLDVVLVVELVVVEDVVLLDVVVLEVVDPVYGLLLKVNTYEAMSVAPWFPGLLNSPTAKPSSIVEPTPNLGKS